MRDNWKILGTIYTTKGGYVHLIHMIYKFSSRVDKINEQQLCVRFKPTQLFFQRKL